MFKINYDKTTPVNMAAAIILCFSLINAAIGVVGISILTLIIVIILLFLSNNITPIILHSTIFVLIFSILIVFGISFICLNNTEFTKEYCLFFVGYCIISMVVGLYVIEVEKVLKIVSIIGLVCTLIMIFVRGIYNYNASLQMGITYSMLPVLMSSYILIVYFRRYYVISATNIALITYVYFNVAPRGIWVVIGIFFIISVWGRIIKDKYSWKKRIITILLLLVTISVVILIINNMQLLLQFINNSFLQITGHRVYAINKFIFFWNQGDISNGRDSLWRIAVDAIKESPIIGHGIGYFESIAGGYTHNIFLQSLCEAGLILFIPIIYNIIHCLKTMNRIIKTDKREFIFYAMIFTNGIVILFFSSVYWKLFIFWYLIGYTFHYSKRKTYKLIRD